jgi:uncharacterized membrane protein YbhN (UPF0104 family)
LSGLKSPRVRHWIYALKVLTSLALLLLVASSVDFGAALGTLLGADPLPLLLALGLVQVQIVLSAVRWRFTAARLGQPMALDHAVAEYYVASLLNQVTPGAMAGDLLRAFRAGRGPAGEGGFRRSLLAVVLERLSGQVAFFLVAGAGLALWPWAIGTPMPGALVATAAGSAVVVGSVFAAPPLGARFGGKVLGLRSRRLVEAAKTALFKRGAVLFQVPVSLVIVISYVATFVLCAAAIGPTPPLAAAIVVPLVLLTMLIPVQVGGWGVREVAAAVLWPLIGMTAEAGVATAVLYGLVVLVGSLPGAVLLLWRAPVEVPASRA